MANILTINSDNPGQGRPLRLSDLQALWGAIGSLFSTISQQTNPVVLWGFELAGDTFGPGVLAFGGQLYVYEASSNDKIRIGGDVYVDTIPSGDIRVIEGGASQQFSYKNVVTGVSSDTSTLVFSNVFIDTFNNSRCAMMMLPGGVPSSMLVPGSVGSAQLGIGVVSDPQLSQPHKRIGWAGLTLSLGTSTVPLSTIVSAGGTNNSVVVSSVRLAANAELGINLDGNFPSFPDIIPLSFHVSSGSATVTLNFSQPVASPSGMVSQPITASTYIGVTLAKSINGYIPVGTVAI